MSNNILNKESPMKQAYDSFDIENIGLGIDEYKKYAMSVPIEQTNKLLDMDWRRRAYFQNVIASVTGESGSGKSSFISACALKLGKIYKETHKLDYEPFTVNNVYYEPTEIKERIPLLKKGEILLRDEHLHGQAGIGSDLTTNVLRDAEQQLRKNLNSFLFASIESEDHSNFFLFQTKHIINDDKGYPKFVVAMLLTPRYTDPDVFCWRGLVALPFPNKDYWSEYEKRKDEHINLLKRQYGNNYAPASIDAINILKKFHDELIMRTREGIVKPIKDDSVERIIYDEIGTRKYTNKIYSMIKSEIKERIFREFKEQNDKKFIEIEERKTKAGLEKKELLTMQMEEAKRIKEAKLLAFQEKLKEDKRRNDLKALALEIRQKELEKAREVKAQKELDKERLALEKKSKLREEGNPAHHFVEGL